MRKFCWQRHKASLSDGLSGDGLQIDGHKSKIGTWKRCSGISKAGMVRIAQGLAMAGGEDVGRNR